MANLSNINNKFLVTTGGDVGIGTTSPQSKLQVTTTGYDTGTTGFRLTHVEETNYVGYARLQTPSGDPIFSLGTIDGATTYETLSMKNGNVGIGTSSPIGNLNINGGTGDTTAQDTTLSLTRTSSTSNVLAAKLVLTAPSTYQQNLVFRIKTTASSAENPSYYSDVMTLNYAGNATFAGNVKLTDEKILGLRTSTNDYALQYRDLDFRLIGSADGTTQRKFSFGYYTSDNPAGTWNGKTYINSYTGNVGINVASPGFQSVDGYGQIGIEIKGAKDNNQAPCLRLHETGSGKGSFELRSTRNVLTSGNYFAIAEGTDTFFTIRGDDDGGGVATRGYVGIGTDSPTEKLHIKSTTNGSFIRFEDNLGSGVYVGSRSDDLEFYAGNSEKMVILSGGNVGIGTTTPDYELDVNGSIRAGRVTTNVHYYATTNSASNQYFHIKTSVNANSQVCMHTWSVEGYAYGSAAIIDCKLAFHTDASGGIYGKSYLGSLANNIYKSTDNYVVLVFGTVNTYYTHFYTNLFEGMYTPLNSTVLAVAYSPNNSGVY
jgi:hypothetical protein